MANPIDTTTLTAINTDARGLANTQSNHPMPAPPPAVGTQILMASLSALGSGTSPLPGTGELVRTGVDGALAKLRANALTSLTRRPQPVPNIGQVSSDFRNRSRSSQIARMRCLASRSRIAAKTSLGT